MAAQITPLATDTPSRNSPATFSGLFDSCLSWLTGTFVPQVNALSTEVNTESANASTQAGIATTQAGLATTNGAVQVALATTQANNAAASATAAAAAAGAPVWVSGTTYSVGDCRFSPASFATYRRKTAGAGTIDPKTDTTNWTPLIPTSSASSLYLQSNFGGL